MKKYLYLILLLLVCVPAIAGTINSYTLKSPPDDADTIVIYDSDDGSTKKIQVGDISGSGGGINWASYPDLTTLTNSQEFLMNNAGVSSSMNWEVLQTLLPSGSLSGWTDGGTNVYTTSTTDKVGVGTITPSSTLEIVKQSTSIPLRVSSNATGAGDYLVVNSSGNVGIGSTSPQGKLDVNGSLVLSGAGIATITGNSTTPGFIIDDDNDNTTNLIFKSGRLGIGTTSASSNILSFSSTGSGASKIDSMWTDTTDFAQFGGYEGSNFIGALNVIGSTNTAVTTAQNSVGLWSGLNNTGTIAFITKTSGTNNQRMIITNSGNVGIGTTVPLAKMEIKAIASESNPQYINRWTDNTTFGSFSGFEGTTNIGNLNIVGSNFATANQRNTIGLWSFVDNSGEIIFMTKTSATNTERMRIMNGGNVGIGTAIPTDKLQVNGTIRAGGYKSSDGTAGVTVTTCTSFKNGLCVGGS